MKLYPQSISVHIQHLFFLAKTASASLPLELLRNRFLHLIPFLDPNNFHLLLAFNGSLFLIFCFIYWLKLGNHFHFQCFEFFAFSIQHLLDSINLQSM
jgi:hypothetical protein